MAMFILLLCTITTYVMIIAGTLLPEQSQKETLIAHFDTNLTGTKSCAEMGLNMKYDADSFRAENQEEIIRREAVISQESVFRRYTLEKKLISHVAAGNYEQAVQILDRFSDNPDDYLDLIARIPDDPGRRLRFFGSLLNSMLRVSLLSSQIPVIHIHVISTHFGILLEEAPVEYLQKERILHRIIEAYCYYAGEFSGAPYSETVSKITDYIIIHINEDLSLHRIADAFHFSPAYVNRILKKETGCTTVAYIKKSRIFLAKTLLHFGDLTIADIAVSVGYSDCNYFCRVFKQLEGISPLQFRQLHGERIP